MTKSAYNQPDQAGAEVKERPLKDGRELPLREDRPRDIEQLAAKQLTANKEISEDVLRLAIKVGILEPTAMDDGALPSYQGEAGSQLFQLNEKYAELKYKIATANSPSEKSVHEEELAEVVVEYEFAVIGLIKSHHLSVITNKLDQLRKLIHFEKPKDAVDQAEQTKEFLENVGQMATKLEALETNTQLVLHDTLTKHSKFTETLTTLNELLYRQLGKDIMNLPNTGSDQSQVIIQEISQLVDILNPDTIQLALKRIEELIMELNEAEADQKTPDNEKNQQGGDGLQAKRNEKITALTDQLADSLTESDKKDSNTTKENDTDTKDTNDSALITQYQFPSTALLSEKMAA